MSSMCSGVGTCQQLQQHHAHSMQRGRASLRQRKIPTLAAVDRGCLDSRNNNEILRSGYKRRRTRDSRPTPSTPSVANANQAYLNNIRPRQPASPDVNAALVLVLQRHVCCCSTLWQRCVGVCRAHQDQRQAATDRSWRLHILIIPSTPFSTAGCGGEGWHARCRVEHRLAAAHVHGGNSCAACSLHCIEDILLDCRVPPQRSHRLMPCMLCTG